MSRRGAAASGHGVARVRKGTGCRWIAAAAFLGCHSIRVNAAGGKAFASEMKETSQVTKVGGNGSSSHARLRAFTRSRTITLGSSRSLECSWP